MRRTWENTTTRHGTQSGWSLHRDLGERPCDACFAAKQEYDKRYKSAPGRVRADRRRAAAQQKAYGRLARLYPDVYRAFYEEELAARDLSVPARGET